jgi:hypothetical protein
MLGWGKSWTGNSLVGLVVVEPVLTWFEASDDRMTCRSRMSGRVLTRRRIAAPDVTARRAASEMEPPTALIHALDTAFTTGTHIRDDHPASHNEDDTSAATPERTYPDPNALSSRVELGTSSAPDR